MVAGEPVDFRELPQEVWDLVERRIEAFESAWAAGRRPSYADFLLAPDPTQGQLLVELVHTDFELAFREGEAASADAYLAAHPELSDHPEIAEGLRRAGDALATAGDDASAGRRSRGAGLGGILDSFRQAWQSGQRPRIEDWLTAVGEPERPTLFAVLLATEIGERCRRGEVPVANDYDSRFPEYADDLSDIRRADLADARESDHATTFGRFDLLVRLGAGGFGTVWKAYDRGLERLVAVKIIHSRARRPTPSVLREARAAARLRHPHIVAVHDAGTFDGRDFVVYDLIPGVDLKDWLVENRPSPCEAARLCLKLARAVQHAHERGVIHRDLKPGNVLIGRDGEPRLTDFGLAKRAIGDDSETSEGQVMGSYPYLSPEQAAGRSREADARTDVYGLGVILYELLTGQAPFQDGRLPNVRRVVTDEPVPPRRIRGGVPRDLETIWLKAAAKEPSRRYATAGGLADDLVRFLAGQAIYARRPAYWRRSWDLLKRQPTLTTAPAVAAASVAAALFWGPGGSPAGTRRVSIATRPPNAELRFVPLDEVTGEPRPDDMHDPGRSPVEDYPLPPGDYLVVAALDPDPGDGGRRFHEVYRHVPAPSEGVSYLVPHRSWREAPDGGVTLPDVTIPPSSVSADMARVDGAEEFMVGIDGSNQVPPHRRRVPPFLIDTREVTVAAYRASAGRLPKDRRYVSRPDEYAVTDDWDQALFRLEVAGKRLPTETEYEYAATNGGREPFSWGGEPLPGGPAGTDFGPAGTPADDRVTFDRPVYGLCSNVAEWTLSRAALYPGARSGNSRTVTSNSPQDYRIVRGGDLTVISGDPTVSPAAREPRHRHPLYRHALKPGVGFRGVRSLSPRLNPGDFEAVLPALDGR